MSNRGRTRSPENQRKWYWHQDPQTGWWTWYYHAYGWVPARQRGAKENADPASSTSLETPPQETAGTSSENCQVVMEKSKEKEAVVDMDIDG